MNSSERKLMLSDCIGMSCMNPSSSRPCVISSDCMRFELALATRFAICGKCELYDGDIHSNAGSSYMSLST